MIRKKKHLNKEEHIDETWLIPYADLLTLLLALFIVLFASSSIDAEKFKQLAESFNSSFNSGTGLMDYPSPIPKEQSQSLNKEDARNKTNENPNFDENDRAELADLQFKMNDYINDNQLDNQIKTELTDEGLLLTILNGTTFDQGKAEIKLAKRDLVRDISDLLVSGVQRKIIVAGHTDNTPIHNSSFDSNWDLSGLRAVNFLTILLENKELDPSNFSAQGFGEYKPIDTNNTPEGRAENRRVEILILSNK
jgi:chemotaxis protein MotB